jgi:hypothetical protein
MKIGGIFSDLLTREMKKGYIFRDIGGTLRNWYKQYKTPLNPGSACGGGGGCYTDILCTRGLAR